MPSLVSNVGQCKEAWPDVFPDSTGYYSNSDPLLHLHKKAQILEKAGAFVYMSLQPKQEKQGKKGTAKLETRSEQTRLSTAVIDRQTKARANSGTHWKPQKRNTR